MDYQTPALPPVSGWGKWIPSSHLHTGILLAYSEQLERHWIRYTEPLSTQTYYWFPMIVWNQAEKFLSKNHN